MSVESRLDGFPNNLVQMTANNFFFVSVEMQSKPCLHSAVLQNDCENSGNTSWGCHWEHPAIPGFVCLNSQKFWQKSWESPGRFLETRQREGFSCFTEFLGPLTLTCLCSSVLCLSKPTQWREEKVQIK